MKDIGSKLKEKREENGVSVEEASEDLKLRPSQIESLESGRLEDFSDVFYVKYFIRDYAKYLGLDSEGLLDEFNEFLFDYTSKIPIKDIEEAKKNRKEHKSIISPYTLNKKNKLNIPNYIIYIVIVAIAIAVAYILVSGYKGNQFTDNDITYAIRR